MNSIRFRHFLNSLGLPDGLTITETETDVTISGGGGKQVTGSRDSLRRWLEPLTGYVDPSARPASVETFFVYCEQAALPVRPAT